MITQDQVKTGASFKGSDGEVRHVWKITRFANGFGVNWDSVPPDDPDFFNLVAKENRPHGYMPMREFQAWAKEDVSDPVQKGALV